VQAGVADLKALGGTGTVRKVREVLENLVNCAIDDGKFTSLPVDVSGDGQAQAVCRIYRFL